MIDESINNIRRNVKKALSLVQCFMQDEDHNLKAVHDYLVHIDTIAQSIETERTRLKSHGIYDPHHKYGLHEENV